MSVRRAIFWSFSGQIVSFVATFATTVALARILSPREVGAYAIGLAVTGVLQALSAFGVGTYIIRERQLSRRTVETGVTINALISVLLAALVYAASFSGQVTLGEPMVARVLRLLALVPLIGIFEFAPATMLQREMDFRKLSLAAAARAVATAAVSVGTALAGASSLSAAYGGIAGAATSAGLLMLLARHHVVAKASLQGGRAMVAFGLQTLSIGGISVITMRLSDVVLGRILGLTALGFYSRASALSNMIFQNIYGSASKVLFVKLADDGRAGVRLRASYLAGLDMILGIMWPLLAGLAVLAGPAVALLFGERWLDAAAPLAILMLVQALGYTFAMNHELFVLADRVGQQSRIEAIRAVAGLIGIAVGCRWGLAGAAAGRLADPMVGMLLYIPKMHSLAALEQGDMRLAYVRNAGVTLAAIAPALAVMAAAHWSPAVPVWQSAAAVAAGGLLWLAALRVTRHPLYGEILRWTARLRPGTAAA